MTYGGSTDALRGKEEMEGRGWEARWSSRGREEVHVVAIWGVRARKRRSLEVGRDRDCGRLWMWMWMGLGGVEIVEDCGCEWKKSN